MQFYSADHDGQMTHHDIALMEYPELPAPAADDTLTSAIGHIAIASPDREAGCTGPRICRARVSSSAPRGAWHDHSLYIPEPNGYSVELCTSCHAKCGEGNIQEALNHYVALPTEGEAALEDRVENVPVFAPPSRRSPHLPALQTNRQVLA